MSTELDKDIAATMTPEELEAINAEASPEEQLIMRQQAEADADDEGDDNDADDESKADGEGEAGKDAGAEPKAAADSGVADKQDEPQEIIEGDFKPTYQAQLPEGFDARLANLTEREAALWAKFEAGEIERQDMQGQLRAIETDRTSLNALRVKAEISSEMSQQSAAQEWAWNIKRFISQIAKDEKIDYGKDAEKQADLDMFVRALGSDARNNDKPMDWFLQEAHRLVKAKNGIGEISTPKRSMQEAKAARKPSLDDIPKTLAQVPGGDGPGDLAGEFIQLDSLSGMELENALAKLSPTQRERYSQGL